MPEAATAASGFFCALQERDLPSLQSQNLYFFHADIVLAQPLASEIDTGVTSKIRFFKRRFPRRLPLKRAA
jgi:hypothetical protein